MSESFQEIGLNDELRQLESQLSALVPASLPQSLLFQMSDSMDIAESTEEQVYHDLEHDLAQMETPALPEDVLNRMVSAMDRWHENVPLEEKVVSFDSSSVQECDSKKAVPARKRSGVNYAAAAAVALLGAVAALVAPGLNQGSSSVAVEASGELINQPEIQQSVNVNNVAQPRDAWLVPDSYSHNVTNTTQRGVVMSKDNTPHRVIQIDYTDSVKFLNKEGHEFEIERPGVNMLLVPVDVD